MPHVIVKMLSGRSADQKRRIADAVTEALVRTAGCTEAAVSVAIEDVAPADWTERVYEPDIRARRDSLFKEPGYEPS